MISVLKIKVVVIITIIVIIIIIIQKIIIVGSIVHGPDHNFLPLRGTNCDRCKFKELPKFFNNFDDSSFEWVAFWYIFNFKNQKMRFSMKTRLKRKGSP